MHHNVNVKLTKEQIFFAMLDLKIEELNKLSKEVEFVKEYKKALIEVNEDEFDFTMTEEEKQYYIEKVEELGKKEGKLLGVMQSKIENAKKLLKKNMQVDFIQEVTKLDKKKIESLKY